MEPCIVCKNETQYDDWIARDDMGHGYKRAVCVVCAQKRVDIFKDFQIQTSKQVVDTLLAGTVK